MNLIKTYIETGEKMITKEAHTSSMVTKSLVTTFNIGERMQITEKSLEGRATKRNTIYSMHDIAKGINYMACLIQRNELVEKTRKSYDSKERMLNLCAIQAEHLSLVDKNKNTFAFQNNRYEQEENILTYIYANILEVNDYGTKDIYIFAQYLDKNTRIRADCFVISRKWFERVYNRNFPESKNHVLFGLVKRRKKIIPAKRSYDSITHSSYQTGEEKVKFENRIVQFDIFPINEYGVYCTSSQEQEILNMLCQKNIPFIRPLHPVSEYGYRPPAIAWVNNRNTIIEHVQNKEHRKDAFLQMKEKGAAYDISYVEGKTG